MLEGKGRKRLFLTDQNKQSLSPIKDSKKSKTFQIDTVLALKITHFFLWGSLFRDIYATLSPCFCVKIDSNAVLRFP